jgi:hypothetical protein
MFVENYIHMTKKLIEISSLIQKMGSLIQKLAHLVRLEITLPYAQSLPNTEHLSQYTTVYPNDEVVLIRNVQTTPNKFFIKLKNGEILNATDDTQTLKVFEGILGPGSLIFKIFA